MIAEDISAFRRRFKSILSKQPGIKVVGECDNGQDAVQMALDLRPDIIIMDIQMEADDAGIVATRKIIKSLPKVKIIMITIHSDIDTITEAYKAGITDFLTKEASDIEIIQVIKDAIKHEKVGKKINKIIRDEMLKMKNEYNSMFYCATLISRLSSSELETLIFLCDGMKYREVAEVRFVEETTIRATVHKISKKLDGIAIRDLIKYINDNGFLIMLKKMNKQQTI